MPQKSYRLSPRRQWTVPGVFACLAAVVIVGGLFAQAPSDRWAALWTGLVVAAIGAGSLALVWYPRLTVSSEGLTLRQVGWQVSTTWDNVERLELERGQEGLSLRSSLAGGSWGLHVGRYLPGWYTAEQDRKVSENRWFPLQPFAWWLQHGDLRQEIERYAPRLFSAPEA